MGIQEHNQQAVARQPTCTAAEFKAALEEKRRQMGGTKSAIWGSEVEQLLEDAERRSEAQGETQGKG